MNRTLKLALGAVLGLGLVTPSFAQNFPDIPDNHWAYEALANLKGKVLYGYPDGLFRPARPMSRAEFAVAINQLYQMMMAKSSSMDAAMAAMQKQLDAKGGGGGTGASQADMDAMKKQMADLTNKVNGMAAGGSDMAAMKKLAGEFEKELAEMGVNMDAMKKDMADMAKRLSDVENMKGGVKMSGSGNFVMIAGHSSDDGPGLTPGQRVLGVQNGGLVGMNRDFNVFHDFNVNLSGDAGEGVAWKASFSHNNMFGTGPIIGGDGTPNFGNMSEHNFGVGFDAENSVTMIHELSAKFDTSIGGQGFTAEVGRFRHSGGDFFLKREDTTEFYKSGVWDDGKFAMDGAKFDFGFGGADLTVFMASNSGNKPIGTDIFDDGVNPMSLDLDLPGDFLVDSTLGAELSFKLGENGSLKAVYYWMDSATAVDPDGIGPLTLVNRMNTSGLEASFKVGMIDLWGVFAQTDFMLNNDSVVDDNNTATAVWAGYKKEKWGLGGFWTSIEGNFGAFGDWGRIGTEWHPSNVEGFGASAWFQPSEKMKLSFNGEWFEAADETGAGFFGLSLGPDDKVTSYTVKMNYDLTDAWDLMLSWEMVDWDFGGSTVGAPPVAFSDPEQKWWTVGLSRNLSDSTTFSIKYMSSDVNFKGSVGAGNPLVDAGGWDVYKGGVLSSQLTFKY